MKARIGIIGCGQIVKVRHAYELFTCEDAEVAGFYDHVTERAQEFANLYGGKVYTDYVDMLKDTEVDAVVVCTSNDSHAKISIEALDAGKYVLCEKPMSTSIDQALKIIEAEKKSKAFFMAAHNQRLTFAHKKAKELISSEIVGKVLSFRCTLAHPGPEKFSVNRSNSTWYLNKSSSGLGCVSDLGIHKLDVLMHILGEPITYVSAFAGTRDKKDDSGELVDVYDNAVCILKTPSGVLGTLNLSYTNYGDWDNSTVYYCEKGVIKVHFYTEYVVEVVMKDHERILIKDSTPVGQTTRSGIMDAFSRAVCNKLPSPISAEEAFQAMKVVFAIEEAYQSGRTVMIDV